MEAILILVAIVGFVVAFDVLSLTLGVDSRDGSSDPRSPARGIVA